MNVGGIEVMQLNQISLYGCPLLEGEEDDNYSLVRRQYGGNVEQFCVNLKLI